MINILKNELIESVNFFKFTTFDGFWVMTQNLTNENVKELREYKEIKKESLNALKKLIRVSKYKSLDELYTGDFPVKVNVLKNKKGKHKNLYLVYLWYLTEEPEEREMFFLELLYSIYQYDIRV